MGPAVFYIVAAAVLAFWIYKKNFSQRRFTFRRLNKLPSISIPDFQEGQIGRITGRVDVLTNKFEAPFTKRECVMYQFKVEKANGHASGEWIEIIYEQDQAHFVIRNGEDIAIVETDGVEYYLHPDRKHTSQSDGIDPELEGFLLSRDVATRSFFGGYKLFRYEEGVLEPGEQVCAGGLGKWVDDEWGLGDGRKILWLRNPQDKSAYVSDDPELFDSLEEETMEGREEIVPHIPEWFEDTATLVEEVEEEHDALVEEVKEYLDSELKDADTEIEETLEEIIEEKKVERTKKEEKRRGWSGDKRRERRSREFRIGKRHRKDDEKRKKEDRESRRRRAGEGSVGW